MEQTNRLTIHDIPQHAVGDVAALPITELAVLIDEAEDLKQLTTRKLDCLRNALEQRFGEKAQAIRLSQGKDTGTVRFPADGAEISHDLPKRVEWDQQGLENAATVITNKFGGDPHDYIKAKLSVSEAVFQIAPAALRELLSDARTVKTGRPTISIVLSEGRG